MTRVCDFVSPIGTLALTEGIDNFGVPALIAVDFAPSGRTEESPLLRQASDELANYFAGREYKLRTRVAPQATAFQFRVWQALRKIYFGTHTTYGELARELHTAPRAIGQACRANPVPIFIPCHRVIAAEGIGGFGGKERAIDRKRALLAIEEPVRRAHQELFETELMA